MTTSIARHHEYAVPDRALLNAAAPPANPVRGVDDGERGQVGVDPARRAQFVDAMAAAVNGVSVLATNGRAGRLGITISSFSSVSADPPMVLACINRRSPACAAVRQNGVFSVNLLSTRQREVAQRFAGRPARGEPYDFGRLDLLEGVTGSPCFRGALAVFDCWLERWHDAGSHTIFIGRVAMSTVNAGEQLLYSKRAYGYPCRWR